MTWKKVYEEFDKQLLWEMLGDLVREGDIYNEDLLNYIDNNYTKCDNCGEWCLTDDMSTSDTITSGGTEHICQQCVEDGYAS